MKTSFYTYIPQPPFDRWVQFIWISKGENDTTISRILPNGVIELIINFGNKQKTLKEHTLATHKYFKNYWVAGIQTQPLFIQSLTDTNLVGIRFLPGGAFPFFKCPVSKFTNLVIEATWMNKELNRLKMEIGDLNDQIHVSDTVQKYLGTKFDGSSALNESVNYVARKIFSSDPDVPISELVKKAGYSHKHFIALFKKQVGTTPKNLQRIVRLQEIIRIVKEKNDVKWTDILYSFPYHDSAHFAHDFKELTGITPDSYLALKTFDENHCILR